MLSEDGSKLQCVTSVVLDRGSPSDLSSSYFGVRGTLTTVREISALDRFWGAYLGKLKWSRLKQSVKVALVCQNIPVHAFK